MTCIKKIPPPLKNHQEIHVSITLWPNKDIHCSNCVYTQHFFYSYFILMCVLECDFMRVLFQCLYDMVPNIFSSVLFMCMMGRRRPPPAHGRINTHHHHIRFYMRSFTYRKSRICASGLRKRCFIHIYAYFSTNIKKIFIIVYLSVLS